MKSLIRFDWAAKRILRDKANFEVLEGFLSVLLGQQIKINEILESEDNQDQNDSKFNRVDIMARNSEGELIIVEIQLSRQVHFLKTGRVREDTEVPGLREAKRKLDWLNMSEKEKRSYDAYLMNLMNERECLNTARQEGIEEGLTEGIAIGKEEGLNEGISIGVAKANLETARKMKEAGIDTTVISSITGLSPERIATL